MRSLGILCLTLLAACSVIREPQDGGPRTPVDVSGIPDAQPQTVVRTRAGNAQSYRVFGKTYRILTDSRGYKARGKASWYGTKFHGRKTANGETYNMYGMTAAHKTLPIPSYVRVTRVSTGQSIVVRINDRGPFKDNRLIDLSYAAARKLGIDRDGVALVDVVDVTPQPDSGNTLDSMPARQAGVIAKPSSPALSPLKPLAAPKPTSIAAPISKPVTSEPSTTTALSSTASAQVTQLSDGLYLQLGAFQQRSTAVNLQAKVMAMLVAPVAIMVGEDNLHRVKIGPTDNEKLIDAWQRILEANGLSSGFVFRAKR